jgi:hypothetical protein
MRNKKQFSSNLLKKIHEAIEKNSGHIVVYGEFNFDKKYDEFVKNKSIYSMDYELIDDMIQHFEEQEEYEKCSVLLKFKQDYAENAENTESRK